MTTKKMSHDEKRSVHIMKIPLISLRPLEKGDKGEVCRWMMSSYILHNSFVIPSAKSQPDDFRTLAYAERYFTVLLSDKNRLTYAILKNGLHIGNVGLKEISIHEMTAECFIEIGDTHFRGKGYGTIAMGLLLDIAFLQLRLSKVFLDVLEFNFPALKIYHRLGFNFAGLSGWHYDEFGMNWQVIKMVLRQSDWLRIEKRDIKYRVFYKT